MNVWWINTRITRPFWCKVFRHVRASIQQPVKVYQWFMYRKNTSCVCVYVYTKCQRHPITKHVALKKMSVKDVYILKRSYLNKTLLKEK